MLKRDREIAALKRQLQQAGIDYQPEQDEQLQAQVQSVDADRVSFVKSISVAKLWKMIILRG